MTSFTIDDVRESFTADVTGFLDRIEQACNMLSELQLAAAHLEGRPLVDVLHHDGHALRGTTGLVGATSLASCAAALEHLAESGQAAMGEIEERLGRVRQLSGVCLEGARAMRHMLALELDKRSAEAKLLADEWLAAAARVSPAASPPGSAAAPPAQDAAPAAEFDFGDEGGTPEAAAAPTAAPPKEFDFEEPPTPEAGLAGELQAIFQQEARELMAVLQGYLQALADRPNDMPIASQVERIYHTLKGASATVGLTAASELASELQRRMEQVCETAAPVTHAVIEELLEGTNRLFRTTGLPEIHVRVSGRKKPRGQAPAPIYEEAKPAPAAPRVERVDVQADPEVLEAFGVECTELLDNLERSVSVLEDSPQPQQHIGEILRLCHTLKGSVNAVGLTPTGAMLHEVEDFLEALQSAPIMPALRNVVGVLVRVHQAVRHNLGQAQREGVVESPVDEIRAALAGIEARRSDPAPSSSSQQSDLRLPSSALSAESSRLDHRGEAPEQRFLRVPAERVDALMNLAAELVVGRSRLLSRMTEIGRLRHNLRSTNSRLHQSVEDFREEYEFANLDGRARGQPALASAAGGWGGFGELELDRYEDIHVFSRTLTEVTDDLSQLHGGLFEQLGHFAEDTEALGTIVSGLQTELTRARMVPLEGLFARLRLAARDAAEREGRSVRTHTTGEKVSLDKTIVDALYAPLLHLVRNAVTHGIEPAERRSAVGKPPNGVVSIGARQESGRIVIEVADDGAGLDLPALLDRGVAMGLVPSGTAPGDPRVLDLVFASGLSTRAGASSVSGRGVGGNVVRRAVERMNGAVSVRTQQGRGTIFEITLPLTLAITRALLVAHAARNYFVPLAFADRILDSAESAVVDSAGLRRVLVDDEYVVVRGLSGLLGLPPTTKTGKGALVVLRFGDRRIALEVDGVVGQEEIVVKNLGELLHGHPVFAGVSIRGNGELALILDAPSLVDESRAEATLPVAAEVDVDVAPVSPSRPRVLFVDDSLSVRKVAEKFLVALGADVTLAVDGIDGMSRLRAGEFDLVFTDLEMPRLHGYELIREIRAMPALRKLPVVVVTSRSSQRHREQAQAVGATNYLTKPFTQEALSAILDELLLQRLGEEP